MSEGAIEKLQSALNSAYDKADAIRSCSHFVWHVIQAYVPDQPYLEANQLIHYMALHPHEWQELAADDSIGMATAAKSGTLIVGGRQDKPNGHVVVVYPGDVKESGGYGYKSPEGKTMALRSHGSYARCMSRSMGNWPGAQSRGEKTIWDPWAGPKFAAVRFWALSATK